LGNLGDFIIPTDDSSIIVQRDRLKPPELILQALTAMFCPLLLGSHCFLGRVLAMAFLGVKKV